MRLFLSAGAALCAALLMSEAGAEKPHTQLPEGTAVVIVGRVSSPPKGELNEQKMQIAVGPRKVDYTVHIGRAAVIKGPNGEEVDEDAFDDGQWIRAEGRVMDDPRRIMASRVRLITTRELGSLRGSPYYRRGFAHGYLTWPAGEARVAGSRMVYRRAE